MHIDTFIDTHALNIHMYRHAYMECAPKYMLTLTGAPKRTFIYAVMHAFTRLCMHVHAHTHKHKHMCPLSA